jgi:hypothetical protein
MKNSIQSSPSQPPISSVRFAFCLLILARLLTMPISPSSFTFSNSVTFFRSHSLSFNYFFAFIDRHQLLNTYVAEVVIHFDLKLLKY